MASRKFVWVKCCICDGVGMVIEPVPAGVRIDGVTLYKDSWAECTNCSGDKGHRMPVFAPDDDPDAYAVNQQQISPKNPWPDTPPKIKPPDWWYDADEPALD